VSPCHAATISAPLLSQTEAAVCRRSKRGYLMSMATWHEKDEGPGFALMHQPAPSQGFASYKQES
jgi:hypothetical protein